MKEVVSKETVVLRRWGRSIKKLELTFRALVLRQSESRNCGLCVVFIVE